MARRAGDARLRPRIVPAACIAAVAGASRSYQGSGDEPRGAANLSEVVVVGVDRRCWSTRRAGKRAGGRGFRAPQWHSSHQYRYGHPKRYRYSLLPVQVQVPGYRVPGTGAQGLRVAAGTGSSRLSFEHALYEGTA